MKMDATEWIGDETFVAWVRREVHPDVPVLVWNMITCKENDLSNPVLIGALQVRQLAALLYEAWKEAKALEGGA